MAHVDSFSPSQKMLLFQFRFIPCTWTEMKRLESRVEEAMACKSLALNTRDRHARHATAVTATWQPRDSHRRWDAGCSGDGTRRWPPVTSPWQNKDFQLLGAGPLSLKRWDHPGRQVDTLLQGWKNTENMCQYPEKEPNNGQSRSKQWSSLDLRSRGDTKLATT